MKTKCLELSVGNSSIIFLLSRYFNCLFQLQFSCQCGFICFILDQNCDMKTASGVYKSAFPVGCSCNQTSETCMNVFPVNETKCVRFSSESSKHSPGSIFDVYLFSRHVFWSVCIINKSCQEEIRRKKCLCPSLIFSLSTNRNVFFFLISGC